MAEMTMVERVARAIYEGRNGVGAVAWAHRQDGYKDPYRADARAAIEAMREPTPEMAVAGFVADAFRTPMARLEADFEPKAVHRAMVDAALTKP